MRMTGIDRTITRQIVDRCHVGESNRGVVTYFISRLKSGHQTWAALPRGYRREVLRFIIRSHAANRGLYRDVVTGGI